MRFCSMKFYITFCDFLNKSAKHIMKTLQVAKTYMIFFEQECEIFREKTFV